MASPLSYLSPVGLLASGAVQGYNGARQADIARQQAMAQQALQARIAMIGYQRALDVATLNGQNRANVAVMNNTSRQTIANNRLGLNRTIAAGKGLIPINAAGDGTTSFENYNPDPTAPPVVPGAPVVAASGPTAMPPMQPSIQTPLDPNAGLGPATIATLAQKKAATDRSNAETNQIGANEDIAFRKLVGVIPPPQQADFVTTYNQSANQNHAVPGGTVPLPPGIAGPPAMATPYYTPDADQQAKIDQQNAAAAAAQAGAVYTAGPKTDVANSQAHLNNVVSGIKPKQFDLQVLTQQQKNAYQNRVLQLQAQHLSQQAAQAQAQLELGQGRLGLDTMKYTNPTTGGGTGKPFDETSPVYQGLAKEKNNNLATITQIQTILEGKGLDANKQPIVLSRDQGANYRNRLASLQNRNTQIDRLLTQGAPPPPVRGLAPLPVGVVTNGNGKTMPGVSVPNVPVLPNFGGNTVYTNRAGQPTATGPAPVHHSSLQPRSGGGQFNGPPKMPKVGGRKDYSKMTTQQLIRGY